MKNETNQKNRTEQMNTQNNGIHAMNNEIENKAEGRINQTNRRGLAMNNATIRIRTRTLTSLAALSIALGATVPAYAIIDNTATVSGTSPRGNTITDSSTENVTTDSRNPEFTIAKSISTLNDESGEAIIFQYVVDNTGNVGLDGTSVSITDPGPQFNGSGATNTLGSITYISGDTNSNNIIDTNESWTYQASYTLAQADVDNAAGITNGVTNTVTTASITDTSTTPVAATFDTVNSTLTAQDTLPDNSAVTLAKIATRDGSTEDDGSGLGTPGTAGNAYIAGETITYVFTVENTGNTTLSSLTVSDTSFTGAGTLSSIVCTISTDATIATLAPGGTETCTATYVVQEGDLI